MENKSLILPEEVVQDIGLSRNKCTIVVEDGEFSRLAWCSDVRTVTGCRGEGQSTGCLLRDTPKHSEGSTHGSRIDLLEMGSYKIE